jgi:hypothetical protein
MVFCNGNMMFSCLSLTIGNPSNAIGYTKLVQTLMVLWPNSKHALLQITTSTIHNIGYDHTSNMGLNYEMMHMVLAIAAQQHMDIV